MTLDPRDMTRHWTLDEMASAVLQALRGGRELPGDREAGYFWRATKHKASRNSPRGGGTKDATERRILLDTSHGRFVVVVRGAP